MERASQRRLEAHAVLLHPRDMLLGLADRHAREALVGEAAGHLEEVVPVLLFRVRARQDIEGPVVHGAHVARVPAVAAAEMDRGGLDDEDREARAARGDGGAQRGVASAQDQKVVGARGLH